MDSIATRVQPNAQGQKKGSENVTVDHLSRLINQKEALPLQDDFSNEQLLVMTYSRPLYADIVNYIVTK